jgi:hypothetical protein
MVLCGTAPIKTVKVTRGKFCLSGVAGLKATIYA